MEKKIIMLAVLAIIAVAAVAIFLFAPGSTGALGPSNYNATGFTSYDNMRVNQSFINGLNVSNNVSNYVVQGSIANYPQMANGSMLTYNGKPEILYIGAEYCPYCAAERWAMIIALSRFGKFTGIEYMTSSATDAYANTPTFTFVNATYSSPYISFVPVEIETNKEANGGYPALQNMTQSESIIANKYDPGQGIPFIDMANYSIIDGSQYLPNILQGMDWDQIAAQLKNPNSTVAKAIIGSADVLTAEICKIDNNKPAGVCGQSYVLKIDGYESFK